MFEEVLVAGFGGQGVLFLGKLLSEAALEDGKRLACSVSYGPEMRGGTANTGVIISDQPIGSVVVTHPTVALVMNQPSMDKFEPRVRPGGLLLANSTLVSQESRRTDIRALYVPATGIGAGLGNKDVANVVLLGVLMAVRPVVSQKALDAALERVLAKSGPGLLAVNREAMRRGGEWAKQAANPGTG